MKFTPFAATFAVVALVSSLFLTGCPSLARKADDTALFEPAQLIWPSVEEDLERGIADGYEDGDLSGPARDSLLAEAAAMLPALTEKDREAMRLIPWENLLEPWVDRGIDDRFGDGEIGPGVAVSLREQRSQFGKLIIKIKEQ